MPLGGASGLKTKSNIKKPNKNETITFLYRIRHENNAATTSPETGFTAITFYI